MNRTALLRILAEEGFDVTSAKQKEEIVTYKGRKYRMTWSGTTKFGERAKLEFMDGSKEFWVPLDSVTRSGGGSGTTYSPARGSCRGCGGPIRNAPHHRAMDGYCGNCAFDEFDM